MPVISQAPVLILRSQDITVRDLTVRNGRNWNVNIVGCDRVTLRRCKVLTPPACVPEFTDGIDVVSTDRLTHRRLLRLLQRRLSSPGATRCVFASPLLDLAQSRELSHCVVRGMVGWNPRANGIRFGEWGTSSMVGIHDIRFENCDFCGMAASGLFIGSLVPNPKSPQPPRYGTLKFVDCGFDCDRVMRYVFLMRRVQIERLELVNVAVNVAGKAAVFEGLADGKIGRLVFRNLTRRGQESRQSQAGGYPREERGHGGCRVAARTDSRRRNPIDRPPRERHNSRPMASQSAASRASVQIPGAWPALLLLLSMNLFNYIDRQVLAAVEPEICQDLLHADRHDDPHALAKMGLLSTAFLVSYMVVAPLFGWLAERWSRWLLIAIGIGLWSLASGASGLAVTFTMLLWTRCLVGVGEGAYGPVAPTIIADFYPVAKRGQVLSWFYMAIPVGSALGYVLGGYMAALEPGAQSWRWAFYVVVIPGLLLGLGSLWMREPRPGATEITATAPGRRLTLERLLTLLQTPSYVLCTLGMTAMTFAVGALGFWMPRLPENAQGGRDAPASSPWPSSAC